MRGPRGEVYGSFPYSFQTASIESFKEWKMLRVAIHLFQK